MSKHTPGLWKADYISDGRFEVNGGLTEDRRIIDGGWSAVATVEANSLGSRPVDDEEAEANARLISAAPELLDALLAYVEIEESMAPASSSPLRERARAAIRKAGIA